MPNLIFITIPYNNEMPPKYLKQNTLAIIMLEAGNTAGTGEKVKKQTLSNL